MVTTCNAIADTDAGWNSQPILQWSVCDTPAEAIVASLWVSSTTGAVRCRDHLPGGAATIVQRSPASTVVRTIGGYGDWYPLHEQFRRVCRWECQVCSKSYTTHN